jgi:H+-transporting ATPase
LHKGTLAATLAPAMADEDRVLETSAESLWDESSFSVATGHPVAVDDDRVIEAVLRSVNLDYGLSSADVEHERKTAGFNEEPQHHVSWVLRLVRNFVGVAPVILEATFIAAMALQEWIEAGVVLALLIFNAIVGFVQDTRAVQAMARLHSSLQINARVLRDGNWNQILARELVPGDVVKIRQGDMVPADLVTNCGELLVDQSAPAGESNAVAKLEGSRIFAGSMVTSGETRQLLSLLAWKRDLTQRFI